MGMAEQDSRISEPAGANAGRASGILARLGVMLVFIASTAAFFLFGNVLPEQFADAGFWRFLFIFSGILLLAANIVYFAWQILLVKQYRPFPDPGNDNLPTVSVIVPAFNEGHLVSETLQSLLRSDYPLEKLEIITVNDGSRDDTWKWMYPAVQASGGRTIAVDLPRNAGKRNAIYKGMLVSTSEVIVTLDSDTQIPPRSLRELVAPFCHDETIGGVAGNLRVLNPQDGLIPRMLDVSFVFGFEFLKSAQSMVRSVLCQPGAFSAFRRSALMPHMKEWLNETIFGRPAVIGEDRALTNILLREGWGVVFQRDAVSYSEMPTGYGALCKMMIRWTRGNFRENFYLFKYVFKKLDFRDENLTGMQINLIVQTFWQISPIVLTLLAVWSFFTGAFAFFSGIILSILFWSTLPAFVYARRYSQAESLWSYVYGFFSFVTMFWVAPYSVLTVHHVGWMTRQNPAPAAPGKQAKT